jgi:hypothetical protein
LRRNVLFVWIHCYVSDFGNLFTHLTSTQKCKSLYCSHTILKDNIFNLTYVKWQILNTYEYFVKWCNFFVIVIRICKSKDRQHNDQKKKEQTTTYNILQRIQYKQISPFQYCQKNIFVVPSKPTKVVLIDKVVLNPANLKH